MDQAVPAVMGGAEFARYLGTLGLQMTRQAVSKSNVIPRMPGGTVRVAEALMALHAAGRLDRLPGQDPAPPPPPAAPMVRSAGLGAWAAPPEGDDAAPAAGRPRGGGGGYYEEKAQTERVIRELKEIELAKARGELVSADAVRDAQMTIARRVGERLEQLATLAGELSALAVSEGEIAVRAALRKAVRALREDLAAAVAKGAVEDEDEPDDDDQPAPSGGSVSVAGGV